MKYQMTPTLSLVITPETPEEQALVNLMNKMSVRKGGWTIHNAGMTYAEGRRESVNIEFVGALSGQNDATAHDVKYDDAFGHSGVDTCKNCESNSMRADWKEPCKGKSDSWLIGPCPHCGHDGFSRPYGMNPEIYECNKCKGTWHRGWKP